MWKALHGVAQVNADDRVSGVLHAGKCVWFASESGVNVLYRSLGFDLLGLVMWILVDWLWLMQA